jgi:hypothetical protein
VAGAFGRVLQVRGKFDDQVYAMKVGGVVSSHHTHHGLDGPRAGEVGRV